MLHTRPAKEGEASVVRFVFPFAFYVSISTKKENTGMFDILLLGTRASGKPFVGH
jgi:hypothetical protein